MTDTVDYEVLTAFCHNGVKLSAGEQMTATRQQATFLVAGGFIKPLIKKPKDVKEVSNDK